MTLGPYRTKCLPSSVTPLSSPGQSAVSSLDSSYVSEGDKLSLTRYTEEDLKAKTLKSYQNNNLDASVNELIAYVEHLSSVSTQEKDIITKVFDLIKNKPELANLYLRKDPSNIKNEVAILLAKEILYFSSLDKCISRLNSLPNLLPFISLLATTDSSKSSLFQRIKEMVKKLCPNKDKANILLSILMGFSEAQFSKLIKIVPLEGLSACVVIDPLTKDAENLNTLLRKTQTSNIPLFNMLVYLVSEYVINNLDNHDFITKFDENFQKYMVSEIAGQMIENPSVIKSLLATLDKKNRALCHSITSEIARQIQENESLDTLVIKLKNNLQLTNHYIMEHFSDKEMIIIKLVEEMAKESIINLNNLHNVLKFIGKINPQLQEALVITIVKRIEESKDSDIVQIYLNHPELTSYLLKHVTTRESVITKIAFKLITDFNNLSKQLKALYLQNRELYNEIIAEIEKQIEAIDNLDAKAIFFINNPQLAKYLAKFLKEELINKIVEKLQQPPILEYKTARTLLKMGDVLQNIILEKFSSESKHSIKDKILKLQEIHAKQIQKTTKNFQRYLREKPQDKYGVRHTVYEKNEEKFEYYYSSGNRAHIVKFKNLDTMVEVNPNFPTSKYKKVVAVDDDTIILHNDPKNKLHSRSSIEIENILDQLQIQSFVLSYQIGENTLITRNYGENLFTYTQKSKTNDTLNKVEVKHFFQILSDFKTLHIKHYHHNDIKSGNMVVRELEDGTLEIKVIDLDTFTSHMQNLNTLGTRSYTTRELAILAAPTFYGKSSTSSSKYKNSDIRRVHDEYPLALTILESCGVMIDTSVYDEKKSGQDITPEMKIFIAEYIKPEFHERFTLLLSNPIKYLELITNERRAGLNIIYLADMFLGVSNP